MSRAIYNNHTMQSKSSLQSPWQASNGPLGLTITSSKGCPDGILDNEGFIELLGWLLGWGDGCDDGWDDGCGDGQ